MRNIENAMGAAAVYAFTSVAGAQYSPSNDHVLPTYASERANYNSPFVAPEGYSEERMAVAGTLGLAFLAGLVLVAPRAMNAFKKSKRTTSSSRF